MLRFFPYLMICLVIAVGGRLLNILDIFNNDNIKFVEAKEQDAIEPSKNNTEQSLKKAADTSQPSLDDKKQNENNHESKIDQNIPDLPSPESISNIQHNLSSTEIDLLKSLSKRRKDLDNRESGLAFREKAISGTNKQIAEQVDILQSLNNDLKQFTTQYNSKYDEKNARLVKIYETMRPKDAARIFEEMQLNVLLEVLDKMKETKLANILSSMDPIKAKEITIALVRHKSSNNNINKK
jgi:flagellar motility protein MotE (MotC chaperone)